MPRPTIRPDRCRARTVASSCASTLEPPSACLHQRVEAEARQMPLVKHDGMAQGDRLLIVRSVGQQAEYVARPRAVPLISLKKLSSECVGGRRVSTRRSHHPESSTTSVLRARQRQSPDGRSFARACSRACSASRRSTVSRRTADRSGDEPIARRSFRTLRRPVVSRA